jgi:hypothetical protein
MSPLAAKGEMRRLSTQFITAWYLGSERPVEGVLVREHTLTVADRRNIVVLHCIEPSGTEPMLGLSLVLTEDSFALPSELLTADERRNACFAFRRANAELSVSRSLRHAIGQLDIVGDGSAGEGYERRASVDEVLTTRHRHDRGTIARCVLRYGPDQMADAFETVYQRLVAA